MGPKTTTNDRSSALVAQPARRAQTKLPPLFDHADPASFQSVPAEVLKLDPERVAVIPDDAGNWLLCYFFDGPPTLLVEAAPGSAAVYRHRQAPEAKALVLGRYKTAPGG